MDSLDSNFRKLLLNLKGNVSPDAVAYACNYQMEERVSLARQTHYETGSVENVIDLDGWSAVHKAYLAARVQVPCPETFTDLNFQAAHSPPIEQDLHLIRIERLDHVLQELRMDLDHLSMFVESLHGRGPGIENVSPVEVAAMMKKVARSLNTNPFAGRPRFAGLEAELVEDINASDCYNRLRNRLGLRHHDPIGSPIPVALMRYSVKDVRKHAEKVTGATHPITVPCVLDHELSAIFCPAPANAVYGRTIDLEGISSKRNFISEVLHLRIDYLPEHIYKMGAKPHLFWYAQFWGFVLDL